MIIAEEEQTASQVALSLFLSPPLQVLKNYCFWQLLTEPLVVVVEFYNADVVTSRRSKRACSSKLFHHPFQRIHSRDKQEK
ncbi:MAG: hypothetical protein AABX64_01300 [Nanoarchaeota archaeon]